MIPTQPPQPAPMIRSPTTTAGALGGSVGGGTLNASSGVGSSSPFSNFLDSIGEWSAAYQRQLDFITPYTAQRWMATGALLVIFMLRVILAHGWYLIAYALGIYLLNLFLAFLSPKIDPALAEQEALDADDGPTLPTKNDETFRPFIRRLPEFKFWYWSTRGVLFSLLLTITRFTDIPVFWPILLIYFCMLFVLTMRKQIEHMVRYKYVPFDVGRKSNK